MTWLASSMAWVLTPTLTTRRRATISTSCCKHTQTTTTTTTMTTTKTALYSMGGYLDNLSCKLQGEKADDSESEYDEKFHNATKLEKDQIDCYGMGIWNLGFLCQF
ncbi:hypothetical protein ACA910_014823 [Epithemia clementina (nom. ined.)]